MSRRKIELKYKKERVVFSDVLPYEIPLIFSNRYFYRFLVKYKVKIENNKLIWDSNMPDSAFETLKLLLGISSIEKNKPFDKDFEKYRIPFSYNIAHKRDKFRELAIIHPLNQLQVIDFYEKYKYLILHYCNQSNFSIRYPDKIAYFFFYKDRLHRQLLGKKTDSREEYMNEYENLKSYFSYQKYSNIYKFYEDFRYQKAEKKFNNLIKFDIQDCFNSIYTHSITWATLGGIDQGKNAWLTRRIKSSFGYEFDEIMQKMNFAETNGIVIGPEFSRIFAEIILQKIDKDIEAEMILKGKHLKKDYDCYRYVDDYFLFYNDDKTKNQIIEQFTLYLRKYKMTISDSKTKVFEKPFITDVTIAKQKIDQLLSEHLKIKINVDASIDKLNDKKDKVKDFKNDENKFDENKLLKYLKEKRSLFINPNKFNSKYKAIIKETGVEYKTVINYSLSRICSKLETLLKKFDNRFKYLTYYKSNLKISEEKREECAKLRNRDEKALTQFIINILEIVFFLYSNNKRINTTLKVLAILNVIVLYFKNNYNLQTVRLIRIRNSNTEMVFNKIRDEINLVMQTTPFNKNTQLEAFYLLLSLKEMGPEYVIPDITINEYLDMKNGNQKNPSDFKFWNTLLISILLHYYGDLTEFKDSLVFLKEVIKEKIKGVEFSHRDFSTELTILKMDLLTCPYLDDDYKKEILILFGVKNDQDQNEILAFSKTQKTWFIKWKDFNMNYEINAKISQEVYS